MHNRSSLRCPLVLLTGDSLPACDGGTALSRGARGGRGGAQVMEAGSHPERAFLRVTSLVGALRKEGTRDRVQKPSSVLHCPLSPITCSLSPGGYLAFMRTIPGIVPRR